MAAGTIRSKMAPHDNIPLQCVICRNLTDVKRMRCKAFPAGIPAAILENRYDHTKPFPGDGDVRFVALPD